MCPLRCSRERAWSTAGRLPKCKKCFVVKTEPRLLPRMLLSSLSAIVVIALPVQSCQKHWGVFLTVNHRHHAPKLYGDQAKRVRLSRVEPKPLNERGKGCSLSLRRQRRPRFCFLKLSRNPLPLIFSVGSEGHDSTLATYTMGPRSTILGISSYLCT